MMFCGAFVKSKTTPKYLAVFGITLVLALTFLELSTGKALFNIDTQDMLRTGNLSLSFLTIAFGATLIHFLLNGREFEKVGEHVAEYFALIFFVLCGVSLIATFNTLLILFIGIEIMTIPLFILTGSDKRNLKSIEAALKYFLMGSFSTGIMLMGIAFIYGGNANGSFYLNNIQIGVGQMPVMIAVGLVFMLVALAFKVSAAPFHFWTPDVYDGAPTVFTSFMSTVVKAAGFFAFLRLFQYAFGAVQSQWQPLIVFLTAATLFIGNITAVFQQSVKRMLAYSSIAQAGFMLFAIFALNERAQEGIVLYAAAYSLATIGIFAVLIKMDDYTVDGFNGLAKKSPLLALTATVFLLSLTGIPLTAGFQSKFYMLMAALENGRHLWLVIFAVVMAAVSAYYYFRVIQAMYFREPAGDAVQQQGTAGFRFMLVLVAVLILLLGVYPEFLIGWIYH